MTQPTPSPKELAVIRRLVEEVAAIAASPENEAIKQRWRDVNALRTPDRPPVWCRPVGAWSEILPPEALECEDPELRGYERALRMALVKHDIGDDTPVEGFWPVGAALRVDPANTWGVDVQRHSSGAEGGAWAFDPPLKCEADFDSLRVPRYELDQAETDRRMERAHDILGDSLPPRLSLQCPLQPRLGGYAADLRGLEQISLDMALEPDLMHHLMGFLRDATLQAMDDILATGRLTRNNLGPMMCSDPIGQEHENGATGYDNLWCLTESQEFGHVSPAMWEEFLLEYQLPILERYGLTGYGCCEDLTHKIDGVLRIPNLRTFVCSAWTDLDRVLERVPERVVIMWRQKASDVVFPDDLETLRSDLVEGTRKLSGRPYQIVLRELQTLAGHPRRLHDWTRLAIEAASN
jgi:hypothetical protein